MRKLFLAAAFAIAFAMQAAVGSSYTVTMQKVVAEVPDDIEESEYGHLRSSGRFLHRNREGQEKNPHDGKNYALNIQDD